MEAHIARLDTHVEHIDSNVADLLAGQARQEVKVDQGFARLDLKMDQGFARLEGRIERLEAKVDRHLLILGGMIVSLGVWLTGLLAKGFHWV